MNRRNQKYGRNTTSNSKTEKINRTAIKSINNGSSGTEAASAKDVDTLKMPQKWIEKSKFGKETITLEYSKCKGRYAVAKRDIKEGEIILEERPYLFIVTQNRMKSVCDCCCYFNSNNLDEELKHHCTDCGQVYYCNEQCYEKAMNNWHRYECALFKELINNLSTTKSKMIQKDSEQITSLCKMIMRVIVYKQLEKQSISIESHNDLERSLDIEQDYYNYKFIDFASLCGSIQTISKKKINIITESTELIYNSILNLSKSGKEGERIKMNELVGSFSKEVICKIICKEECNSFGLFFTHKELSIDVESDTQNRMFGFGLYPALALLNHSCSPNVYKLRGPGNTYYFRALKDIPMGTELCITYIYLDKNTNQRRHELEDNYGFYCTCQRCEDEDDLSIIDPDDLRSRYLICDKYNCGGLLLKPHMFNYLDDNSVVISAKATKSNHKLCNRCGCKY